MNDPHSTPIFFPAWIDGKWRIDSHIEVSNAYDTSFPVYSPNADSIPNDKPLALVATMQSKGAVDAVEAAHKAFPIWSSQTSKKRADLLLSWYDAIMQHKNALAAIITAEQGKPIAEAENEIDYGAGFVRWFAEEARRSYGSIIPAEDASHMKVIKQPMGVTTAITPWNFPMAMITRKVAPALAAGCTSVVKPSELTPVSALALASLWQKSVENMFANNPTARQACLSAFNVICGKAEPIGKVFCTHPSVAKLSFTGSTDVGKHLAQLCGANLKRYTLELGGSAPFVVFSSADIDQAVKGAITSRFRNSGQTCVCANRFYVDAKVHDEFCEKLAKAISQLCCGNGFLAECNQGALITPAAREKVIRLVDQALRLGAKRHCGGKQTVPTVSSSNPAIAYSRFQNAVESIFGKDLLSDFVQHGNETAVGKAIFADKGLHGGGFFQPTLLSDVPKDAEIHHTEIFGPVVVVSRFKEEDEAISLANSTRYGLAAYFYSNDLRQIARVERRLKAGIIGVNTGATSAVNAPFGGVDHSGQGKEGGALGIEEYLDKKYIKTML